MGRIHVDGATIENVSASDLTLEEVTNSVIFLRLGHRARGPAGTGVGAMRNIAIRHLRARRVDGRFPIVLSGLPGHTLEDIVLEDVSVESTGGITLADVAAINGHTETQAFGRRIPVETVQRAADIAILGLAVLFVIATAILLTQPIPYVDALFEAVSALGTVGLSLGATSRLDGLGKIVIMAAIVGSQSQPVAI